MGEVNYGLGRLPSKDERDAQHLMRMAASDRTSRFWYGYTTFLNQGETPECVGYSWSHFLVDSPKTHKLTKLHYTPEQLYFAAQKVDEFPGEDYEGTSVRGAAKALKSAGVIGEYVWAANLQDMINAILEKGPVVVGTNWYEEMFNPDSKGYLNIGGGVAGGHAWKVDGVNVPKRFFRMKNSWGRDWGNSGFARLTFDTMERLLSEDGEACMALEV